MTYGQFHGSLQWALYAVCAAAYLGVLVDGYFSARPSLRRYAVPAMLAIAIAVLIGFSTTTYAAGFNCDFAWWTLECWLT